jgi:UDP-2,3-diacylglucosamine pyrophosphatase LpxH
MKHLSCLVLFFLLAFNHAYAKPFDCGPFLLKPGANEMVIVVDNASSVKATLTLHPEGRQWETQVFKSEKQKHHVFNLKTLLPDTKYCYRVTGSGGLDSGEWRFHTLPKETQNYKLVAFGDIRSQPKRWKAVADLIHKNESDALYLMGTGDYPSYGASYKLWVDQVFTPGRTLLAEVPLWPAIGNHEATISKGKTNTKTHYFRLFELPGNERWFRIDDALHTLIILDTNVAMDPKSEQFAFLKQQLQSKRRLFTILVFHSPVYDSGGHSRLRKDGKAAEQSIRHARRYWAPMFEKYGVDLVLSGHNHLYERSKKRGVHYITTGGGGAPLYTPNKVKNPYQIVAKKVYHYCRLTVSGTRLDLHAIDVDGNVIDHFFIRK